MAEIKMPGDVIANEFASVSIAIDHNGNGPRLRLKDLQDGREVFLDALALATIIWLPDGVLESWHDPALRWSDGSSSGAQHVAATDH